MSFDIKIFSIVLHCFNLTSFMKTYVKNVQVILVSNVLKNFSTINALNMETRSTEYISIVMK